MRRDAGSHKGENGTVAVVGGSHTFHGAPIFSSLAAERSGVDLVYPVVHGCHAEVTKAASPAFIVRACKEQGLAEKDVREILSLLREVHAAVLGPGMADAKENDAALAFLVKNAPCALVLDARALRPPIVKSIPAKTTAVLTPHIGELERITGKSLTGIAKRDVQALVKMLAKETHATVVLKGETDFIATPQGKTALVKGGNAGLTKGGTGDALAGLIAGLLAQGLEPLAACTLACRVIKQCADDLFPKKGYAYSTLDVINHIPEALHKLNP